jgi:hypothetical protein
MVPIAMALMGTADNMRASFNEHYITAILQFFFQLAIYGAVYLEGIPKNGVLFSACTLQFPSILASLATLLLLLIQRPYLLTGKVHGIRHMMMPILAVIAADGSLTAVLNVGVYWLGRAGEAEYAAWFGTFVRLFQTVAAVLMIVLLPITSYISIRWQTLTIERRLLLHKLFVLGGAGYGATVGLAMAAGGTYYIKHFFAIAVAGDTLDLAAITLCIGAVIALKTYALLLYSISEALRLSLATAGIALLGVVNAGVASLWISPIKAVDVLLLTTGALLPVLLVAEWARNGSTPKVSVAPGY